MLVRAIFSCALSVSTHSSRGCLIARRRRYRCQLPIMSVVPIDYRCDVGRFLVSASYVTISNPDSLSSSETGFNSGIRSWKSNYLNELDVRKPLVVSISQRVRAATLQPGLEFDNFEPWLESDIFKRIPLLNGLFFWGWSGFYLRKVETYRKSP